MDDRSASPPFASTGDGSRPRPRHRIIDLTSEILETIARRRTGLGLTEISRAVNAPLSTTQGLVNGLVVNGYLDERNRKYYLGVAPYILNLLAGRGAVNRISHDDIVRLHNDTGFTTVLSVAVGQEVIYIDHLSTDPTTSYLAKSHVRRSIIGTSSGWVLLADLGERDLWAYLSSLGEEDKVRAQLLLHSLSDIRESNMCILPGVAANPETDGISIAIREDGRTVAAVGVVGPRDELTANRVEITDALRSHSRAWHARA